MSGTELSRLMAEVTAQPPLDVDFSAVARQVERRDRRLRRTAAGAGVLAVAAIVGVPTVYGMSGQGARVHSGPPNPSPVVTVDATWRHDSWNTLTWRTPGDWLPSAAYPDHSRPSNAYIEGPYIGNARLPVTSPSPRPVRGSGILGAAGPVLAPDAVVAWYSYGERSAERLTDGSPFSDATPPDLAQECARLGAGRVFHAARQFGTQSHGSNLVLEGCISATDPALYEAQLRAVLASAVDSAYPAVILGAPATSATATGSAGASWDQFHWRMPATWQLGKEPPASSGSPGVLSGRRYLGPAPFRDPCALTSCDPGKYMVGSPVLASIVFGPLGPTAPANPNPGSVVTNDGDCTSRGVKEAFVAERDFGTVANGERLGLEACLLEGYSAETLATLKAVVASVTDDSYPPMAAPLTPTAIASGTTAVALCTSALGPVDNAVIATVGDVRDLRIGPDVAPVPHAFGNAPRSDPAAWCWTGKGTGLYTAWAVHEGDAAVRAGGVGGGLVEPSGEPMEP